MTKQTIFPHRRRSGLFTSNRRARGWVALFWLCSGCAPAPHQPREQDPEARRAPIGPHEQGPLPPLLVRILEQGHPRGSPLATGKALVVQEENDGAAPVTLREPRSGVALRYTLRGARGGVAQRRGKTSWFPGAAPGGDHLFRTPIEGGLEEYVVQERPTGLTSLTYDIHLEKAAGLRLVGGFLEVLDKKGAPRIRLSAPAVFDAKLQRQRPQLELEGCEADKDPRAPWGRPTTPPGASSCAVRISWLPPRHFPVVIDPAWTSAGNMAFERFGFSMTTLSNQRVLAAGGTLSSRTAEIFDPETETWAATGELSEARTLQTSSAMGGRALIISGKIEGAFGTKGCEIYDPATGQFSKTASLPTARWDSTATELVSGTILVVGGGQDPARTNYILYDPSSETWSEPKNLIWWRARHTANRLPDGRVLIAGSQVHIEPQYIPEIYDESTGTTSEAANMKQARTEHASVSLPGGNVMLIGGHDDKDTRLGTAEIYDHLTNHWETVASMALKRAGPSAAPLPGSRVLVFGGVADETTPTRSAEIFDPGTNRWFSGGETAVGHHGLQAQPLPGGRVLAAGYNPTEIFQLLPNGTPCTEDGLCDSLHCVDGVCCESGCEGLCHACSAALKGGGNDGECGIVLAGTDPRGDCADEGPVLCKKNGLCDGQGVCMSYPSATGCVAETCTKGEDCASGFCKDDVCCDAPCSGKCEACTRARKGYGRDGVCEAVALGIDPKFKGCATRTLCDGEHTLTLPDTSRRDCSPFRCAEEGVCLSLCSTKGDCVSGARCDSAGQCTLEPLESATSSCAFSEKSSHAWALLLAVWLLRQRQTQRRSTS